MSTDRFVPPVNLQMLLEKAMAAVSEACHCIEEAGASEKLTAASVALDPVNNILATVKNVIDHTTTCDPKNCPKLRNVVGMLEQVKEIMPLALPVASGAQVDDAKRMLQSLKDTNYLKAVFER